MEAAMIKPLRKSLNLSVNDLSELIDVNERTIRRWETLEVPTPKAVLLLMKAWVKHGVE
jgi:DNA-binding transcriptional regulator YiaG